MAKDKDKKEQEPEVQEQESQEPAEPKDKEHVTMAEADYWCELFGVEREGLQHALKVSGSDSPDVIRQFILGT